MEQTIAPKRIEMKLLAQEAAAFPGWGSSSAGSAASEEYAVREEAEWREADLIVCGSEFVRAGIGECGGDIDRCRVVPYGIEPASAVSPRTRRDGPLRVLIVGAVGLRKGSPYVLAVARLLKGRAIFRMIGNVTVPLETARELRSHVELLGGIPRSEVMKHYAWADVFLLPSICEGSATVCYEALAAGLPAVPTIGYMGLAVPSPCGVTRKSMNLWMFG